MSKIVSSMYDLEDVKAATGQDIPGKIAVFACTENDMPLEVALEMIHTPEEACWTDSPEGIAGATKKLLDLHPDFEGFEDLSAEPFGCVLD